MSVSQAGRTAVVLGGTHGIGKELVKSLAAKGETVYLSGRTQESANAAAEAIGLGTICLLYTSRCV